MIKTKSGMGDDFLKILAHIFKATNEDAKKQGILLDYKILLGDASSPHDFDILLMEEYKNMAAFDGLRDKFDPIYKKLLGGEDVLRKGSIKRMEIREVVGAKIMREITLK